MDLLINRAMEALLIFAPEPAAAGIIGLETRTARAVRRYG